MTSIDSNPLSSNRQPASGSVIVYHAGQSDIEIQLDAEHRTIWVTKKQIAQALELTVQAVGQQIKNFKEQRGEAANRDIKQVFITATDGKTYEVEHYDATVISFVGFRAQASDRTIQFQDWIGEMLDKAITHQPPQPPTQTKPLSPAQQLLMAAQQLVDHEDRLNEVERRVEELHTAQLALSGGEHYFTIKGYFNVKGLGAIDHYAAQRWGIKAAKLSRTKGVSIGKAFDPLFGEVNSYAESILAELLVGVL